MVNGLTRRRVRRTAFRTARRARTMKAITRKADVRRARITAIAKSARSIARTPRRKATITRVATAARRRTTLRAQAQRRRFTRR